MAPSFFTDPTMEKVVAIRDTTSAIVTLIAKTFAADPDALRMVAQTITTSPKIDPKDRDLDVALTAALAARSNSTARRLRWGRPPMPSRTAFSWCLKTAS